MAASSSSSSSQINDLLGVQKKRRRVDEHHGGSHRVYMKHKNAKFQKQNELIAQGLDGELQSTIFRGEVFWLNGIVHVGCEGIKNQTELRDLILRNGGLVENTETKKVTIALGTSLNREKVLQQLRRKTQWRMQYLKPVWVLDCIKQGKKLEKDKYIIDELRFDEEKSLERFGLEKRKKEHQQRRFWRVKVSNLFQWAASETKTTKLDGTVISYQDVIVWVDPSLRVKGVSPGMQAKQCDNVLRITRNDLLNCMNTLKTELSKHCKNNGMVSIGLNELALYIDKTDVDLATAIPNFNVQLEWEPEPSKELKERLMEEEEEEEEDEEEDEVVDGQTHEFSIERRFGCDFKDQAQLETAIGSMILIINEKRMRNKTYDDKNTILHQWLLMWKDRQTNKLRQGYPVESEKEISTQGLARQLALNMEPTLISFLRLEYKSKNISKTNTDEVVIDDENKEEEREQRQNVGDGISLDFWRALPSEIRHELWSTLGEADRLALKAEGLDIKMVTKNKNNSFFTTHQQPTESEDRVKVHNDHPYVEVPGRFDTDEELKDAILTYIQQEKEESDDIQVIFDSCEEFIHGLIEADSLYRVQYVVRLLRVELLKPSTHKTWLEFTQRIQNKCIEKWGCKINV